MKKKVFRKKHTEIAVILLITLKAKGLLRFDFIWSTYSIHT